MDNSSMSPADIAALTKDGNWGDNNCLLWIILFFFICGFGNNGWGNQGNGVLDATLAASAAQGGYVTSNQLNDQLRLQELQTGQRDLNDAIAATEQRLTANQTQALANQAMYGQQMQTCCAEIQSNCNSNYQKIMDKLNGDKIESLQRQVAQLQMQNALGNVVRYPTQTTYTSGMNPFCGCCQGA